MAATKGDGGASNAISLRSHRFVAVATAMVGTGVVAAIFWRRLLRWAEGSRGFGPAGRAVTSATAALAGDRGGKRMAEVASHSTLKDVWIVIRGNVYNITEWVEDHPGGALLLLAFAGRDATEVFDSIGHSRVALREMERFHVGRLLDEPIVPSRRHASRIAQLTGGHAIRRGTRSGCLWEVAGQGFLPAHDPVGIDALTGTVFEVFAKLAHLLPAMATSGTFRVFVDTNVDLHAKMRLAADKDCVLQLSEDQLERAFATLTFVLLAYWRGGTLPYSTGVVGNSQEVVAPVAEKPCASIPPYISEPLLLLSEVLDRPPMLDYAGCVLYNWERVDPDGPITTGNIRCILRLTGLLDEEWFFKTHVVIESEAAQTMQAVAGASKPGSDEELLQHLVSMEEGLWRLVRACLPIMYERDTNGDPKCSEHVFYHVIRPLIGTAHAVFETTPGIQGCKVEGAADENGGSTIKRLLHGPSGAMSTLLPCVDAVMGIHTTSQKLASALKMFEHSMPKEHREVLAVLRSGTSVRNRILACRNHSDKYASLVVSFNRCIARILDFRWQHWQYVKNFIMKPGNVSFGAGTGGTSFDYLQQHITDTEQARIIERHAATDFSRMTSPGTPGLPMMPSLSAVSNAEFWSVDGPLGLLARDPAVDLLHFDRWAQSLPHELIQPIYTALELATKMPAIIVADGPFTQLCEQAAGKLKRLQDPRLVLALSESTRERLMTVFCHLAAGCTGSETRGQRPKAPDCIDRPLRLVARSVGRPPRLEFTEIVLCNWSVTHSEISEDTTFDPRFEQTKLHVSWRFLASPDEEWYRAIHILMHREAREVVAAIRLGQRAMTAKDDAYVTESLQKLTDWCNSFCNYLDSHFEQKDSRTEPVMFGRLGKYVSSHLHEAESACWVYVCGSSVLLPALHAFFGIKMCAVDSASASADVATTVANCLAELRSYMPRTHRAFLEELEQPGTSVRHYCYRRFSAKTASVELMHAFDSAYNDGLSGLIRLMSRRLQLFLRIFPERAQYFGAFHGDVEREMRRARLQLLKMRQRASRVLEH